MTAALMSLIPGRCRRRQCRQRAGDDEFNSMLASRQLRDKFMNSILAREGRLR
jgi:hypothetical protein